MEENRARFKNIAFQWSDAHRFSPAPRHRRRIILNILKKLDFHSCLDTGCAQPYLLEVLLKEGKLAFGCDISDEVIRANKNTFPGMQFEEVDISKETYPFNKKFDLVISSEVLEHIEDWRSAVKNLIQMSRRYLLITVPTGKVHNMDRLVGHFRHYNYEVLRDEIEKNNFKVVFYKYWGMPFHAIYKYLISFGSYEKAYQGFAAKKYGITQKLISHFLYLLFYFNDIFHSGSQLFILGERMKVDG